ncbi:MAG: sulfurtransferase [Clostridia bacterium]|nr:sulfurtransferase [Clostridia bacterium]
MKSKMKKTLSIMTLLLIVSLLMAGCVNDTSYSGTMNIVEATQVVSAYGNSDAVIIDARGQEAYDKGHFENALCLAPSDLVVDKPVAATLAPKAKVERELSKLGIEKDDTLYVYDDNSGVNAGRVWWTLKVYGHENVMIVNGGTDALLKAGLEPTKALPMVTESAYEAEEADMTLIAGYDEVKAVTEDENSSVKIIDVRSIAEYEAGNIPGAILYPHTDNLYKDGTFKSARDIYLFYSDKGIERDDALILYCKSSFRATQALAVLQEAGYENVKVYDGAWLEWSSMGGPTESQLDKAPVTVQDGS